MPDESPLEVFLIPSPQLGTISDVVPERITAGMNEWITLSKQVLAARRARPDVPVPPSVELTDDHHQLRPFGAQHCPALQEMNTVGWLLKWPANAVLKRAGASWEIKATNNAFYGFHPMSSFPEAGQAQSFSVNLGWIAVTPPGWSTLIKNVPNNLSGWRQGMQFAEGIVRTDQATAPLQVHCFLEPTAPKEIVVNRGDPMCLLMPFKRETLALAVMDDPESVADASRLASRDQATFGSGPGRYRALYVDDTNLSPLYPALVERRARLKKK